MSLVVLLIFMNLFYAGTPTFTKLAGLELLPLQIVFLRHSLALLAFLPLFLSQPQKKIALPDFSKIMLASFLAFTLASFLQVLGMHYSRAADGSFIMAMEPLIVIALAYFVLQEKLNKKTTLGLIIALAGFVILSNPSLDGRALGNCLFLLATAAEASFPIFLKPLLQRYPPIVVAFYCLLCASCYLFPFQNIEAWTTLWHSSYLAWLSVAYLGMGCSFLGCLLWLNCLSRMTATLVAISWFVQPVFGCLFAYYLLEETLTLSIWLGGGLIFSALGLLTSQTLPKPAMQPAKSVETLVRIRHPLWEARPVFAPKKELPANLFLPSSLKKYLLAKRIQLQHPQVFPKRSLH